MPSADAIDRIMKASGRGVSSNTGGSQAEPSVYWGSITTKPVVGGRNQAGKVTISSPSAPASTRTGGTKPRLKPLADAQAEFYRWSDTERQRWGQHLTALGLIDEDEAEDYATLKGMWDDIVGETANFTTAGKRLTPWEVAELVAGGERGATRRRAAGSGGGSGGGARFSGTKSQTARSVDLTDPATAKALVNDTLSRFLGRDATDEEVATFRGVLNSAEQANPTVTTSSTTYADGDAVSQSSTTSGGLNGAGKQQLLTDQARALPEYGAYQASTTYAEALFAALAAPV